MDPLTRYKQKLEKDKLHIQEYERIQREKEIKNELKLKEKKDKYTKIQTEQEKQNEIKKLKAELRQHHYERTLFQSQQLEKEKLNQYKQKIAKTLDNIDKYENGFHKEYLNSLHRKLSNHSHQVESVIQQNETIKENRVKQVNSTLESRFKKSEEMLSLLSKQNSDRKKSEKMKIETYQIIVEKHQEQLQQKRELKGKQFEDKLNKIEQLQKLKEQQQKEKQLLRIEADKLKEKMAREFQEEIAKMKSKQIKLIQT